MLLSAASANEKQAKRDEYVEHMAEMAKNAERSSADAPVEGDLRFYTPEDSTHYDASNCQPRDVTQQISHSFSGPGETSRSARQLSDP